MRLALIIQAQASVIKFLKVEEGKEEDVEEYMTKRKVPRDVNADGLKRYEVTLMQQRKGQSCRAPLLDTSLIIFRREFWVCRILSADCQHAIQMQNILFVATQRTG